MSDNTAAFVDAAREYAALASDGYAGQSAPVIRHALAALIDLFQQYAEGKVTAAEILGDIETLRDAVKAL